MTTQQVLDKQGLQHYATKMCNAENRKVGSKSLPTALNDIDTAIDGFKTLFDNEYGTPVAATIENNSNIFTVGTGNGIDKSNEVQNSFTDIELSGNSLVNCILLQNEVINLPYIIPSNKLIIKPNTKYTFKSNNNTINPTFIPEQAPTTDGLLCWLDARDYISGDSWKDRSGNNTRVSVTNLKRNNDNSLSAIDSNSKALVFLDTQKTFTIETKYCFTNSIDKSAYI